MERRKQHRKNKRKSTNIDIANINDESSDGIAREAILTERSTSYGLLSAGLVIVFLGVVLFLLSPDAADGSYKIAIPEKFSFKESSN